MTPEERAEFDQSSALVADSLPPMWWRLYTGLIKEGFTKEQAMELLKTFIAGQSKS
jgi:hypothetical protein